MSPHEPFAVLFVCTGNICRSPAAELLAEQLLSRRLGPAAAAIALGSAGTAGLDGHPLDPDARDILRDHGVPEARLQAFRARALTTDLIARADLVLGLTAHHRSAVLRLHPGALPITFTLREFARLSAAVDLARLPAQPAQRARDLVGQARERRAEFRPSDPDEDAVPDPYRRGTRAHRKATDLIAAALTPIVTAVAP